ncbi:CPBP family intramembrane glutamic endopeptidase [Frigoriflavimonas asaccharolytica]|uniref:CAAX prenyl protease 2/Lysostaphin resistance protein A-like domain-containing protein n=1 Tax=Frigoriflavimonas asaccharolytica TaxID=2735899 RepID=A0A8J8K4M5_9FLAO|nr:type II CAAX endopeptidase family protein [Frigoriflavimonas asaccharolytica]NRS91905.1 hypothetical protein [Frigoriflavimonas asaccharolytica]
MKGWLKNLLLIIPYFLVVGTFQYLGGLVADRNILKNNGEETSIQLLSVSTFGLIGTFLLIWVFMKFLDKQKFQNLGFEIKNRLSDILTGFLIGFFVMLIAWLFLIYLKEIEFYRTDFDWEELTISVLIFIVVAVVEETLFRGYILKNFMESYNKYIALLLSSIIFSLAHGLNPNVDLFSLFNISLAGIFLGLSYIYTKNLWFPIALHFSWNFFQSFLGFNVSGQDIYSVIEFKITKGNTLNGGNFGFEGSYLSIIAMLLIIFSVGIYYNRNRLVRK